MRWGFTLLLLSVSLQTLAQLGLPPGSRQGAVRPFNEFVLSDWNLKNDIPYQNIEGSPFLSDSWSDGELRTIDDQYFYEVPLKVNLYEGQLLHHNSFTGDSSAINLEMIWEFSIPTADSNYIFTRFQSPEKEPTPLDHFFVVLHQGEASLLARPVAQLQKSSRSSIVNSTGKLSDRFVIRSRFYLLKDDNTVHKIDQKKSRMAAFGAQYQRVRSHVKMNQYKWDSAEDLRLIITFYNQLNQ